MLAKFAVGQYHNSIVVFLPEVSDSHIVSCVAPSCGAVRFAAAGQIGVS